ncbi:vitamin K-dependent gamma-carboxylase isoform X2 [Aethina tumida]|nr:vitamin K-dependent gamma-carboxylase isoform X2 [Aethina tumida]
MYRPKDPSSLGIIRFLFGLLMTFDIIEERGGSIIDIRWGDPKDCHFPLFPALKSLQYPYMTFIYGIMWLGAFGVMVGFKFRLSMMTFAVPYWFLLMLDKSFWNNHSYLFGVVSILLTGSCANHYWSLDSLNDPSKNNTHIPYWNYFILKFQFFMLYFLAGLKKTDFEWLEGYSMTNLGSHWVFIPFQYILSLDQIDYLIVHWFGFLLDLTIGFWMLVDSTRPIAMIFCSLFHLMNSRLFSIGMFPYVCLATMPLFCKETWPKNILKVFCNVEEAKPSNKCIYTEREQSKYKNINLPKNITWKHRLVVALLLSHCGLQTFMPYSHFITKGYNNWTNGLYGYSWDMMVHSWNTILIVVKVVDNNTGREQFIDSKAWTHNDRWNKHADMCMQYAQCIKDNLINDFKDKHEKSVSQSIQPETNINFITSENISIYIDVWCSMNGRFQQRMYDPNYDLLKANWSPFKPVEWLLPVLSELNDFRELIKDITQEVYSWSNQSEVLFIADFPGMYLENFINSDVRNVSLTVLEGDVVFEMDDPDTLQSTGIKLHKGDKIPIAIGYFHKIHTIGSKPSCYMYTYAKESQDIEPMENRQQMYSPFPMIEDVQNRLEALKSMFSQIYNSIMHLMFNKPLYRRSRLNDYE